MKKFVIGSIVLAGAIGIVTWKLGGFKKVTKWLEEHLPMEDEADLLQGLYD